MSRPFEVFYADGISYSAVEQAASEVLERFEVIRQTDRTLEKPIIDRDLIAVAVALKPEHPRGVADADAFLAIAQIGAIPRPQPYETFMLKAVSRAFAQRDLDQATDILPMEQLSRVSIDKMYEGSSASVNGLHVGFAGGWAHHGRLLAVSFASSLASTLGLPEIPVHEGSTALDDVESARRLSLFNMGRDSGDNTPVHASAREAYRFVFDALVPKP